MAALTEPVTVTLGFWDQQKSDPMYQQCQIHPDEELATFCTLPGFPPLEPETVARHKADAHWMVVDSTDQPVGRCSLWWQARPLQAGQRIGLIGHYGVSNAAAATQLLQLACEQLAAQGCTIVIGPMDGNTWQQYRLITERGREPLFFLEPNNPEDWPGHFRANGFTTLAQYFSTVNPDLSRCYPGQTQRQARVAKRAASRGIKIRSLRLDGFEAELHQIYTIVRASFDGNFLYTAIEEADFKALYQPLRPYIQPELILIAEQNDQPIGFIFAMPDLLQVQSGRKHFQRQATRAESAPSLRRPGASLQAQLNSSTLEPSDKKQSIDTMIIKTVAIHPDYQIAGLGSLLVARCQEVADDLGYRRAIHALMHERNDSRKISRRHQTQPIRRYALFARRL